ncbi:MAG: UbiD family decarboxylase [Saprospiraceae bacterium]
MSQGLKSVIDELYKAKQLKIIDREVDPNLEMAEIHFQVYEKNGPALLFTNVKNSPFPAVSNVFGTNERIDFIFKKTLPQIKKVIQLKADPSQGFKNPLAYLDAAFTAFRALPTKKIGKSASMFGQTTISKLPQIKSWPDDGGAFITLPQVCTFPPKSKNPLHTNIGMYRIQLSGNSYLPDKEIGLHYQIHRGIGVHHTMYNDCDEPFKVSIFIGGHPAHTFSAIMPMPEGISELTFAGMLSGSKFRYTFDDMGHFISSDADFVITGTIDKSALKPEGPFGDHLGYYSLQHDFPVVKVDRVYHRKDAIWHFTAVGRPPQEDSGFGYLIHKLVDALTPGEFPGLKDIHAVDAAGVHPLLLAVGSERYMPFREPKPEEILTIANRILGSGQTSLAKFLFITAPLQGESLNCSEPMAYFDYVLRRIDWRRDVHFITATTIDTLDYSGHGWNQGSKVIMACHGKPIRSLKDSDQIRKQIDVLYPCAFVAPGILCIQLPSFKSYAQSEIEVQTLISNLSNIDMQSIPWITLCDDAGFVSENSANWLWVTFTRSNPAADIYGFDAQTIQKHWGCIGPLIVDARKKPHHAPSLIRDHTIQKQIAGWLTV